MNLKHIKSITWDEALSAWEKEEAELPHWIQHYKERGFNSWRDWRADSIKAINPKELSWDLFEVLEPLKTVPEFYSGPFRAWIKKYYGGREMLKFGELANNIEIQQDSNINEIIRKFPQESMLIGLLHNNAIVVIEGLHRGCALAVANKTGVSIDSKIFIACAEF